MTWTRLDDAVYDHPKLADVDEPAARLLWVWSLCWSNRFGTNGFLPVKSMRNLGRTAGVADLDNAAAELVEARLWIPVEGGWQIHDFLDYNPSAEKVADISAKRSAAGQRGGRRSGETRSKVSSFASPSREANPRRLPKQNRSPSRPVPSPVTDVSSSSGTAREPSTGGDDDDDRTIDLTDLEAVWDANEPPLEQPATAQGLEARAWAAAVAAGEADTARSIASGRTIDAPARYALACAKERWALHSSQLIAAAAEHPDLAGSELLERSGVLDAIAAHPAGRASPTPAARPRIVTVDGQPRFSHTLTCPTCQGRTGHDDGTCGTPDPGAGP